MPALVVIKWEIKERQSQKREIIDDDDDVATKPLKYLMRGAHRFVSELHYNTVYMIDL